MVHLWAKGGSSAEVDVDGISMHPTFRGVRRVRARLGSPRVRFGDIILFLWDGRLVVHRALGRTSRGYRTRGDASKGFDPNPVPENEVVGVVTHLLTSDGYVSLDRAGGGTVRRFVGSLSLLAGWLRVSPTGSRPGSSFPARVRDLLLSRPLRFVFGASFRTYAWSSRLDERATRTFSRKAPRRLLTQLRLDPAPTSRSPELGSEDWRQVAALGFELGMGPILLRNLQERGLADSLPLPARRRLEASYYAQARANTEALEELEGILEALARESIRPIVLKGAALVGRLYPQVALRTLGDLDLLVRPEEIAGADGILHDRNYRQPEATHRARFYAAHHHAAPYVPPQGYLRVELHTGLIHPGHGLSLDLDGLRARAREVSFGAATARVLCPEDQMIHASLHMAVGDRFVKGVKDLCDIDRLARSEGFDWNALLRSVEAPELGRILYYSLHLARWALGTPVPASAWASLRRHRLPYPEDRLLRAVATTYLTALPNYQVHLGLGRARAVTDRLLHERRIGRRWVGTVRVLLQGGGRADRVP